MHMKPKDEKILQLKLLENTYAITNIPSIKEFNFGFIIKQIMAGKLEISVNKLDKNKRSDVEKYISHFITVWETHQNVATFN